MMEGGLLKASQQPKSKKRGRKQKQRDANKRAAHSAPLVQVTLLDQRRTESVSSGSSGSEGCVDVANEPAQSGIRGNCPACARTGLSLPKCLNLPGMALASCCNNSFREFLDQHDWSKTTIRICSTCHRKIGAAITKARSCNPHIAELDPPLLGRHSAAHVMDSSFTISSKHLVCSACIKYLLCICNRKIIDRCPR